jgi:prepilin-type N-terminal cleavage/methylation domain-containing protein
MTRRGFSLIELLIVIVLIGALASFAVPMVRRGMEARRVSGARIAITTMNAKARAIAVQRSRVVQFIVVGNEVRLVSRHPVTGAITVIEQRDLNSVYGVTVASTRDTLRYDPRGLGLQNSATSIAVSRPGGFADTVVITSLGGIQQ